MITVATLVGLAGLAARWWSATQSFAMSPAGDGAGLDAARVVAEGRLTSFIGDPGSSRPGALGALLLGAAIRVVGEPAARAALAVAIGAIASILLVVILRRRLAGPWPYVAAAVFTSGSAVWVASGADPSDPIVITVLCGLVLSSVVESERPPHWWAVGLVLGVGWWTSGLMTIVALPALASLVVRRRAPIGPQWFVLFGGIVVGGAVRWADEIRHGFPMARTHWGLPADPAVHLRARPLTTLGASIGLVDPDGSWWLPAGQWAALIVIGVLVVAVFGVIVRQPRARSTLLIGAPAVIILDLTAGGWSLPAHALGPLMTPAVAVGVVVALSTIRASARPSAAVVVMLLIGLIGIGGAIVAGRSTGQDPERDPSTSSSATVNAVEE